MTRQLSDIAQQGRQRIPALWASVFGIYGRYGNGLATACLSVSVPTAFTARAPYCPKTF